MQRQSQSPPREYMKDTFKIAMIPLEIIGSPDEENPPQKFDNKQEISELLQYLYEFMEDGFISETEYSYLKKHVMD